VCEVIIYRVVARFKPVLELCVIYAWKLNRLMFLAGIAGSK
jgi:hypothetical protein